MLGRMKSLRKEFQIERLACHHNPFWETNFQKLKELRYARFLRSSRIQCKINQNEPPEHTIHTGSAQAVRLAPYRIPHAYRDAVIKKLKEMEQDGIIEPSVSEWTSPIMVVRKKDGNIRLCVDYRQPNAVTFMDAYPLLRTDELLDRT